MKRIIFLLFTLYVYQISAQVGINTKTPLAILDVNGNMQIRKDIKLGEAEGIKGDPGIVNSVLVSQGPDKAPQWVVTDGIYGYAISQSVLLSDDTGVSFTSTSKIEDMSPITEGISMNGWKEITGLRSQIHITKNKSRVVYSFQTMLQSTASNPYLFTIVAVGIFVDNKLVATRTAQLYGDSRNFFPISITSQFDDLPVKENFDTYDFRIAIKLRYYDYPISTFPTNSSSNAVLVGTSNSDAINTTSFMNQSYLGIDLFEEI